MCDTRLSLAVLVLGAAVLVLAVAGTGRGDFVVTGSRHFDVTSSHLIGDLWDSSTVHVRQGGNVAYLSAYDTGSVDMSGGSVSSQLYAYDRTSVDMSGGSVSLLGAFGYSSVDISGGSVSQLGADGGSSVDISGGSVSLLNAYDITSVDISGGSIGRLYAYDMSSVDISGGSVSSLYAFGDTSVTFHGYDFRAGPDLSLEGERVFGTGPLSGKWFDGTPWAVSIAWQERFASIRAIPEPSTLVLLSMGALGLVAYAWRKLRRQ